MKNLIILSILIFFAFVSAAQDTTASDCLKYHKGKFIYTDSANQVIHLKRGKNYQSETNSSNNVWVRYRIRWKNNCEYELQQISTNSKSRKKFNHGVSTTIITNAINDDGYEYVCGCKGLEMPKEPNFMRKVKNFRSQF